MISKFARQSEIKEFAIMQQASKSQGGLDKPSLIIKQCFVAVVGWICHSSKNINSSNYKSERLNQKKKKKKNANKNC